MDEDFFIEIFFMYHFHYKYDKYYEKKRLGGQVHIKIQTWHEFSQREGERREENNEIDNLIK